MTITLNLPRKLSDNSRAQLANGKTVEGFIKELVEREVVGKDKARSALQGVDQFEEILEPDSRKSSMRAE